MDQKEAERKAYAPVVAFAASIMVLAAAMKVIGVDFEPIFDAWSLSIQADLAGHCDVYTLDSQLSEIDDRLKHLESMAHKPSP